MSIEFLTTILIVFSEWITYINSNDQRANIKSLFFIFVSTIGYAVIHHYFLNNFIIPKLFFNVLLLVLMFINTHFQCNKRSKYAAISLLLLTVISFSIHLQQFNMQTKTNLYFENLSLECVVLIFFFAKMRMFINNLSNVRTANNVNTVMILFIGIYIYSSSPLIFLDSYTGLCFKNTGIYASLINGIVASSMINMLFNHYNRICSSPINKLTKYLTFKSNLFLLEYYIQASCSIFFPILFIITISMVSNSFSGFYGMFMTYLSLVSFTIGKKYFTNDEKKYRVKEFLYTCRIFMTIFIFIVFYITCINIHDGFLVRIYVENENSCNAIFGLTLSCACFSMVISLFCNFCKKIITQINAPTKLYKTLLLRKKHILTISLSVAVIFLIYSSSIINKSFFKYIVLGFTLNGLILTVYIVNLKSIYDTIVLRTKKNILLHNRNRLDIQQQYRKATK